MVGGHLAVRKWLMVLLALALSAVATAASVGAADQPEFKLGFKALADQIPAVVGQPLENEHYGPNGDSLQSTTAGLMVWRKADNWTAFTNGYRTWMNGPAGLQVRLNTERFPWEVGPAAGGAPPSALAPSVDGSDPQTVA